MQCEIARQFFEMFAVIAAEQRIPWEYCNKYVLYHAEIDMLEKINQNPDWNISTLSKKSGVTKSAVTQISGKLAEKGLIEQFQSPGNKKEKYLRLTEAGQQVLIQHTERTQMAARELQNYLCSLNDNEKNTILQFMDMMKRYVPICSFPCRQKENNKDSCFLAGKE